MDEVTAILQAVSTVGFPIVAAVVMFYLVNKMNAQYLSLTEKWSTIVADNTRAIDDIKEMLKK